MFTVVVLHGSHYHDNCVLPIVAWKQTTVVEREEERRRGREGDIITGGFINTLVLELLIVIKIKTFVEGMTKGMLDNTLAKSLQFI